MNGQLRDGVVAVAGNARQQFHDARGYGSPDGGNAISLSRVEAAHLLLRGDLDHVVDGNGTHLGFEAFFADSAAAVDRFALRFLVYAELRDRGFYLSPAREGWPGDDDTEWTDLTVYPRGTKPGDGDPAHRIVVVGERAAVPAAELGGVTLAVVDEESEISYFETDTPDFDGGTTYQPPDALSGSLLDDRVVVWDAPEGFFDHGFYGQPLTAREAIVDSAVQLSLVEAAGLAAEGVLDLQGVDGPAVDAIRERGRAVEGERFDRRLAVYRTLRDRQVVPKTGFKFGADFRTYNTVESVDDLPHSECLVRVLEADHAFDPRELSLDVRLAGGVRKRMVFALTTAKGEVEWLTVSRVTP
ncbi:tRNA-intron lyase [Halohasta salina]|uniref:tRNA-intron lyase n=1 Tax=Halohasta salina TaxID=2961621 RepID=UPI0020A4A726|nr:tRNA-intron lyase [Halohasta salina]